MTLSRRLSATVSGILLTIPAWSCGSAPDTSPESETWVTEPGFEIGDAFGGPAAFAQVSDVRISPDGERVFVLEPYLARVSVWTPGGDLLLDIEKPGEGPGEFMTPRRVHPGRDGFSVQDGRRFTFFTDDGTVSRTVPNPPPALSFQGFRLQPHLVERNGAPGQVVVTEITARGDTVWRRTLGLPPVPIRADMVEDTVQHLTRSTAAAAQRLGQPIPEATARRLAEEALHVPEYHPAVAEVRATTSGELWLRSPEVSDAPEVVWYTVPRGDDDAAPRRVLLPTWFQLHDATDTHVWGVRSDAEDGRLVVGRRLVEP